MRQERGIADNCNYTRDTLRRCSRYDGPAVLCRRTGRRLEERSGPRTCATVTISCGRHEDRGVLEATASAKEVEIYAGVRLRSRRDICVSSAVLPEGVESGHHGQVDRRLGAGSPPRGCWQSSRQAESAVLFQAHTRQVRSNGVVARHTRPGHVQIHAQCQWEIRMFYLEKGD